jgi:MFS family permease
MLEIVSVMTSIFSAWFIIGIFAAYLPLFAYYSLQATNILIGLLATVYFSVNAPSSMLIGYAVDKYRKVKVFLVSALILLFITSLATAYITDPVLLLPLRVLQGVATASIIPLSNLLGAELFGPGRGVGLVNMMGSLGFLLSTLLGGLVLNYISYNTLFIYSSVIPLFSMFIVSFTPTANIDFNSTAIVKLSNIKKLDKSILLMYGTLFLRILGASGVWALFSLYIYSIGGDTNMVGILFAINPVIQTLIFEKFGKISEGRGVKIFELGLILSAIVFLGYYISTNVYYIIPFQIILGFSWVSLYTGINVHIIENTDRDIRGTSLGLVNTVMAIGWVLGSYLSGMIADITGTYKTYILISALLCILAFIITVIFENKLSKKEPVKKMNMA